MFEAKYNSKNATSINSKKRNLWWWCSAPIHSAILMTSSVNGLARSSRKVTFVIDARRAFESPCLENRKYIHLFHSSNENIPVDPVNDDLDSDDYSNMPSSDVSSQRPQQQRLPRIRDRVKHLARKMVTVPINVATSITPMPQAVASVLKDATLGAVDLAVEEGESSGAILLLCKSVIWFCL